MRHALKLTLQEVLLEKLCGGGHAGRE
jgi:hypothetical protein